MITPEQIKELHQRIDVLQDCLGIAKKRGEVAEKEAKSQEPGFWDDPKAAESFLKELSSLKAWVVSFDEVAAMADDMDVLYEFAVESGAVEGQEETAESRELDAQYAQALKKVEALELKNMLGAEGDNLGAVLTINSGAGGTEANDWSAMLMRMYLRWGERNGYKMTVTENQEGDETGIKSATIEFEGDYAYGYLKAESG
ncbi:MAG: PCRF domain-containing protein, partial [Bacteroidales bacterium]|nr:PCRF domain-containing protein [Bacteroidales bacterium]